MESLTYLMALVPTGINTADEVAKRLNTSQKLTHKGKTFTSDVVRNVVYGRTKDYDEVVKKELISLIREHVPADVIAASIEAQQQKLKAAHKALVAV